METRQSFMQSRQTLWVLFAACLVSVAVYLGLSVLTYRSGFPLDDAWIHQTYARNLASRFEWSFIAGHPSGGSTSPLWTLLLAIGDFLRLGPYLWTYLLGFVFLLGLSVLGETAFRMTYPDHPSKVPWVGLLMAFEWHLVWAAGSGMETLATAFLFTMILIAFQGGRTSWLFMGLLAGASVWLRPDGLTLLGPLAFTLALGSRGTQSVFKNGSRLLAGFLIVFLPYAVLTKVLTGTWWPNTFYAKQAEYAILREQPLLTRLAAEFQLPLIGAGVLLLFGFIWFAADRIRRKEWPVIAGLIWWVGYIGLYAWRLPVTYQYGRYVIPAMPIFFIWGAIGLIELTGKLRRNPRLRLVSTAWIVSTVTIAGIFWVRGAFAYANDVAIIETEMVNPARWVHENTGPRDIIAAHDIGALGYFGQREVLDLAGLISPEVIPFIRDEDQLASFLDSRMADYLIVTMNWYPKLSQRGEVVYASGGNFVPASPVNNTQIYRWKIR